MARLQKALFAVPFPDFDYETLATQCGCCQALHVHETLIVVGRPGEVLRLAANLGWAADKTVDLPETAD